jgi:hypothetical protein
MSKKKNFCFKNFFSNEKSIISILKIFRFFFFSKKEILLDKA